MKLTKSKLKKMIKEELLKEDDFASKYDDQIKEMIHDVMKRSTKIVKMLNQQDKITGTKNAKAYNTSFDKHFRKFVTAAQKITAMVKD